MIGAADQYVHDSKCLRHLQPDPNSAFTDCSRTRHCVVTGRNPMRLCAAYIPKHAKQAAAAWDSFFCHAARVFLHKTTYTTYRRMRSIPRSTPTSSHAVSPKLRGRASVSATSCTAVQFPPLVILSSGLELVSLQSKMSLPANSIFASNEYVQYINDKYLYTHIYFPE